MGNKLLLGGLLTTAQITTVSTILPAYAAAATATADNSNSKAMTKDAAAASVQAGLNVSRKGGGLAQRIRSATFKMVSYAVYIYMLCIYICVCACMCVCVQQEVCYG